MHTYILFPISLSLNILCDYWKADIHELMQFAEIRELWACL